MGRSAKSFDVENGPARPASNDLLVKALIAFANGHDVVLWQPSGPVQAWSHWRAEPSPEERTAHTRFLEKAIADPWSALGFFRTDSSGRRRPANAVIELEQAGRDPDAPLPTSEVALQPDQNLYLCLAHMNASTTHREVLVGHRRGYTLTGYRHFKNVAAALMVGMLLVVDQSKLITDQSASYADVLSCCRWCHNFYLARKNRKGGPPNRRYCSPEHGELYHNSAGRKMIARKNKASSQREPK
jgi:hypothetical protein